VIGTAAVEDPEMVESLCASFPGRIALGLDARGREIAVRGWTERTGVEVSDLARRFDGAGLAALIVTQILRDRTFGGPDFGLLSEVLTASSVPVIASGGVGTLDDVRELASLQVVGHRLAGVVVGTAIYEGRFTVADVLAMAG